MKKILIIALLILSCTGFIVHGNVNTVDSSLVLHYRFDHDAGSVAKDLSSFHHDGTIINGKYIAELNGRKGVLHFDGESSYIKVPASPALQIQGDMTFSMWVRQYGQSKNKTAVLLSQDGKGFIFAFEYGYNLLLTYKYLGERVALPVTHKILGQDWSFITVVVEYPRCKFYCNGELVKDQYMPLQGIEKIPQSALNIGGDKNTKYFAPIDLSEFRLYRRALDSAEVAALFKNQTLPTAQIAELRIEPDWYKNILTLRFTTKSKKNQGKEVEFDVIVNNKSQIKQKIQLIDVSQNNSGRFAGVIQLPLDKFADKTIIVTARIADDDKKPTVESMELQKPEWIAHKAGENNQIPPPWTPVKKAQTLNGDIQLEVWGRQYIYRNSPFPVQIESDRTKLLASPIKLSGIVEGKELVWDNHELKVINCSDKSVELAGTLNNSKLKVEVNSKLEYDGFNLYECEITARVATYIDNLTLEIPLNSEIASSAYADRVYPLVNGNYVGTFFSGAITKQLNFLFSPNIWIGNDKMGLTWQAESDEFWSNSDPQKTIQIIPVKSITCLKTNFIDKKVVLTANQKLKYRFALLATPVKPLHKTAWQLRIARYEPWGLEFNLPTNKINDKPELALIKESGVRRIYTSKQDFFTWPMPIHPQFSAALANMVNSIHNAGLKSHSYVIHQRFPVDVPEFDIYGSSMVNRPMKSYSHPNPWPPNPKRPGPIAVEYGADSSSMLFMCAKSEALQDAFLNSLKQRMETYNEDGVYLDGTVHIGPLCYNTEHGCGYIGTDGKLHGTYPTFEIRNFMKRIYAIVKNHNPEAIVDAHSSFGYNPSGLAYADVMWTGEQWHNLRSTGTNYVAGELTLDKFRTEFTGRQIGIAAEVLHYRLRHPMKIAATSLLHDISLRYSSGGYDNSTENKDSYFALIPNIWKMRDIFGADEAKKLYYYENQEYIKIKGNQCYATLLKHPVNGVLALVSNLSTEPQSIELEFNLKTLDLIDRKLEAANALSGNILKMSSDGKINLKLNSEEWIYIWLKPVKK